MKKTFLTKLENLLGHKGYSANSLDRFNYSRDSNFKSTIGMRYGKIEAAPDAIAWPTNTEQVCELVKMCFRSKIPIIPFGAGSGVCGGTTVVSGGLIIDLKKMRQLLKLDGQNLHAVCQAGMMGMHLEDELQRKGYTLGHFPSSILCASLGGYLAARSAGQLSSRYGKIEDMVTDLEVVTGSGEIISTRDVSNREGIDLNQVFLGSEGTLGVITKATLKIYPSPETRIFRGIRFKNMRVAMEAIRRMMQSGIKPAVVRLYDELDTLMQLASRSKKGKLKISKNLGPLKDVLQMKSLSVALKFPQTFQQIISRVPAGCLLVLMHEGVERLVQEEQKISLGIAQSLDGEDLGEEPGINWYAHRYSVSFQASRLFYAGAFTDTIEVAATWDRLYVLYQALVKAVSPHALIMAHLSHVYPEGGSLYFTFIAPLKGLAKSEALYDLIWDRALKACQKTGGVISHHHGIGRLKAKYMEEEWGDGVKLFMKLKQFYDPRRIFNPGKLIEDFPKQTTDWEAA